MTRVILEISIFHISSSKISQSHTEVWVKGENLFVLRYCGYRSTTSVKCVCVIGIQTELKFFDIRSIFLFVTFL